MDVIKQLANEGMAVLQAEQNIQLACMLATTTYIIERGRTVYSAPARDLLENTEIKRNLGIVTVNRDADRPREWLHIRSWLRDGDSNPEPCG